MSDRPKGGAKPPKKSKIVVEFAGRMTPAIRANLLVELRAVARLVGLAAKLRGKKKPKRARKK